MNKIPTAEEFATEHGEARMPRGVSYQKEIGELMVEFAQLHVQAALEVIVNNIGFIETTSEKLNSEEYKPFITADDNTIWTIDKESIINAYPKENIK